MSNETAPCQAPASASARNGLIRNVPPTSVVGAETDAARNGARSNASVTIAWSPPGRERIACGKDARKARSRAPGSAFGMCRSVKFMAPAPPRFAARAAMLSPEAPKRSVPDRRPWNGAGPISCDSDASRIAPSPVNDASDPCRAMAKKPVARPPASVVARSRTARPSGLTFRLNAASWPTSRARTQDGAPSRRPVRRQ